MKILIKKLHENAVIPCKIYPNDFCYDVTAVTEEEIAPNVWRYGLGFAMQIQRGLETIKTSTCYDNGVKKQHFTMVDTNRTPLLLDIDLRPRSSVWKTGMVLSNCEGTIDESYTGEISAVFYHVNTSLPRYKVGDRIGQIKVGMTLPMEFVEVANLNSTDRGANGYGSTGK